MIQPYQMAPVKFSHHHTHDMPPSPGQTVTVVMQVEIIGPAGDGTLGMLPVAIETFTKE